MSNQCKCCAVAKHCYYVKKTLKQNEKCNYFVVDKKYNKRKEVYHV